MNLAITYTNSDIVELGLLPPSVRAEVELWVKHLCGDPRDPQNFPGLAKPIKAALARVARSMGVSLQTARRKYDLLRKAGWRGLINRAKAPGQSRSNLTPEFAAWIKAKAERNQRKTRPAWRQFCSEWRSGKEIPGLDNSLPRHELPPGTGYDNIARLVRDAFAIEAMRHGLGRAIAKHGPKIITSRASLWLMSHCMIDDMWHDGFVVFGSPVGAMASSGGGRNGQIVRALELDSLDAFSGCLMNWGTKPRLRNEDGSMDNLKEKFARRLVADLFYRRGYSPRGTELLAEHGTAAVSEHVARVLFDRTGGLIRLRESGITGEEQAIIGWRGQGKGNPRFKAALESIRNLKHNELADMDRFPGQTGMDVDRRPEFLAGQLKDCEDILKAMAVIAATNPQRARQLKLNLLDYHADFLPLLMDVYNVINNRKWHDLEGWHKAGNVVIEYRTAPSSDHWLTDGEFSQLPEVSRTLLLQAATADPRYLQKRKLSPAEVAARDASQLIKIPPFVIAELLGPDEGFELEVKGAYFKPFQDHELCPPDEVLLYESVIESSISGSSSSSSSSSLSSGPGPRAQLPDGKYFVFVNPFDLSQLFVHDHRNVCLGIARRQQTVDRTNLEQLNRAYGNRATRLAELKKPILARHATIVRQETKRLEHNAAVLSADRAEQQAVEDAADEAFRKAATSF